MTSKIFPAASDCELIYGIENYLVIHYNTHDFVHILRISLTGIFSSMKMAQTIKPCSDEQWYTLKPN